VGTVDGLGFDSGIPPGIIEHDVTCGGEIEAGAGGPEAQEKKGGVGIVLERVDHVLALFGLAGQDVSGNLAVAALFFQKLKHLDELAEDKNLLAFSEERFEQLEKGVGFSRGGIVADQLGVATDLAQTSERGQDVHFAFGEALFLDGFKDLITAAAQFREVKFSLRVAQFAVAPFLDAFGEIFGDLSFEAAEHEGAQFGGEPAAGNFLGPSVVIPAGFVILAEVVLFAEIGRLDEINDAPEVEESVFERSASESETLSGAKLFDGEGDLGAGIFNELGFVQNNGLEGEFLQGGEVAAEQGVIGDDDIVLGNLFAEVMPGGAAFEHENFEMRGEAIGFAPPIVKDGSGADHEDRLGMAGILLPQPGEPGEGLQCFAEPHVISQNAAHFQLGEMAEEIESFLLVGAEFSLNGRGELGGGNAVEIGEPTAKFLGVRLVAETVQGMFGELGRLSDIDALSHRGEIFQTEVGHGFVSASNGIEVEFHPAAVRQFHEPAGGGLELGEVGRGEFKTFSFPLSGDGEPIDSAALNDEFGTKLARIEEQTMEGWVAEKLSFIGAVGPGGSEGVEKILIGISDPEARLGREPIEAAQPGDGQLQAGIIEDFRFADGARFGLSALPIMTGPLPHSLIEAALGEEPEADRVLIQFESELGNGGVSCAELFPFGPIFAELRQEAMAEFAHGKKRPLHPGSEQIAGRRVLEEIKPAFSEGERRLAIKEKKVIESMKGAVGQFE
jgi:hypothetical protein